LQGGDFDDTMLDRDIRSLYKQGLFEFIEIKREAVDGKAFNLVVEVTSEIPSSGSALRGQQEGQGDPVGKGN